MRIYYASHLQQQTGYGRAAYHLARALLSDLPEDIELVLITIGPREGETGLALANAHPLHPDDRIGPSDVLIVHTLPLDCATAKKLLIGDREPGDAPRCVAYTTWEGMNVPDEVYREICFAFDELWVPSEVNKAAFEEARTRRPNQQVMRVVPHCYPDHEVVADDGSRDENDRFQFYWIGQWTARKNPEGLIRAYCLAFDAQDHVRLMLHSAGVDPKRVIDAIVSTGIDKNNLPQIKFCSEVMPEENLEELHRTSDVFVSASRGEAWNLPAFEAMIHRRHIIVPYGHGSDDYLTGTSAELIDGWEAPAHMDATVKSNEDGRWVFDRRGPQGMTARVLWSEPNLVMLAAAMRDAHEHRRRTLEINYDPAQRFGYAAVAALVLAALKEN